MKVLAGAKYRSICFFRLDKHGGYVLPTRHTSKYGELLVVEKYVSPENFKTVDNKPSQILDSPQFANLSQLSTLSVEELSRIDSSLGSLFASSPLKKAQSRPSTVGSAKSYLPPLSFTAEEAALGKREGKFKLPEGTGILGRFIKPIRATPHFVQVSKDAGYEGDIHFVITDENGKDFNISETEENVYNLLSNRVKRDIKKGTCTVNDTASHLADLANLESKPFDRRHRMPVLRSMRKIKPKHKKKHSYNVVTIARGQHPEIIAKNKTIIEEHDNHKEEMELLARKLEEEYESTSDVSCEHDHGMHLAEHHEDHQYGLGLEGEEENELLPPPMSQRKELDTNDEQNDEGEGEPGTNAYEDDEHFDAVIFDGSDISDFNGNNVTRQEQYEMKHDDVEGKQAGILKKTRSSPKLSDSSTNTSRPSSRQRVDSAVNTSRPNSRQRNANNKPIMVDNSVNTSRPSSRSNARKSPNTINNAPRTAVSTMTSRPNSRQSATSSALRPTSKQSSRSSRPSTPSVVRFNETVEISSSGDYNGNDVSNYGGKPPVYGKNMGEEYYQKVGPSPPKASRRALRRGGHNNRPRTSDDNIRLGRDNYVQDQMGNERTVKRAGALPNVVAPSQQQQQQSSQLVDERDAYIDTQYEKFEEAELDGKFGDSFDNRLLTASPTMRLSETELGRLKRVEEIRTQQNVTLVQIIEIERRLEEQRITMLTNALPNDRKRLKSVFAKERKQAGENIRLLVQKHQKELKSAMHAMGVAFLSSSIHDPNGKLDREQIPSLGKGNLINKKKKKKRKKVDRQSKKLKKEIGGALQTLQHE